MAFSTCKYDRELQFIWSRMDRLSEQLDSLKGIDGDEDEMKLIAQRRDEMESELKMLAGRLKDIEESYVTNDMEEYLETLRGKRCPSAPSAACFIEKDEKETEKTSMNEIESITREISELEVRLINAELDGNQSETAKLAMSLSALKSRRSDLIEDMRSEKAKDTAPSDSDVEELKRDVASLRTQVSNLRGDILEINSFIRDLVDKLGIDDELNGD